MPEKRRRTRVRAEFPITLHCGGESVPVQMVNISLIGLLCTSNPLFREGDPCLVTLKLTARKTLNIDGSIVRCSPEETAIAFSSMDEVSFSHLKKLVALNAGDADLIERELAKPVYPER